MNPLNRQTGPHSTVRRAVACGLLATAGAWCSPAWSQAPAVKDCGGDTTCLQERTIPSARDGFALRLALPAMTQSPAQAMGQATPNPAAMFGCDSPFKDMPVMEMAGINQQVLAGRYDAAQPRYLALLRRVEGGRDAPAEAVLTANLGVLAAARGQHASARAQLQQALQRFRQLQSRAATPAGSPTTPAMAALAQQMARLGMPMDPAVLQAAMAPLQDLQATMQSTHARAGEVLVLVNLANLAGQLGQFTEAEGLLKQALARAAEAEAAGTPADGDLGRLVQGEFAVLYEAAGQANKAAEHRRRAGNTPLSAATLSLLGHAPLPLTRSSAAPASNSLTEEAERNRPTRQANAAQLRMQAEALAQERAGDLPAAASTYSRKAAAAAATDAAELTYTALADLARVHAALDVPALAILSSKRAVNAAQQLRRALPAMDRQARQAYLAAKKRSYTLLAQQLMQQGRLAEAEQAFALLKEDEGQQFNPARVDAARPRGAMAYSLAEAASLARYAQLTERTRALESERQGLDCGPGDPVGLIDDRGLQEQRRSAMAASMAQMVDQFEAQLVPGELAERMARARTIVAKRPSVRSAQEREELAEYQQGIRLLDDMVDGHAASLRALVRDAPYFLQPIPAGDLAALSALAPRLDKLRERMKVLWKPVANEPAPPPLPADMQRSFTNLVTLGQVTQGAAWRIDRELERLDAERARLDAEVLDDARRRPPRGEPVFGPEDTARLDTGLRLVRALPAGTVVLYYLGNEQSLDILVVDAGGRSTVRVPVGRAQLDRAVQAYRQILEARREPLAAAQGLHQLLIAPVAEALRKARATTLMLALDGQLRYLPFAALHDGQGWLAERYALALYTTAAPAALTAVPAARWRAAAFGSSLGGQGLPSLPFVRGELEAIVRDPALKTQGSLPGVIRLDRQFTAEALRNTLRERHNVVHMASHFSFRPGDAVESFLLLGDGSRLSLVALASSDYRFDQVDLVTLSACRTGLGSEDSLGQEVEGMGTLLQAQGASAVLASLWSVDDGSTADFMKGLYALREQRGLSRAEALRAVQLSFIRGNSGAATGDSARRGATRPGDGLAPPVARADPSRPWAHPYHWAPFILMGNWL